MFRFFLIVFLLFKISFSLFSQTKTSNGSGNWSNAAIWTPTGVPTSTDNVLINSGNTITFNASGACNSMTVGTGIGTTAIFQYSGNTALTLSVQNNFQVNANGSVLILNTSNTTHSLQLNGNLINNGSFDMNRDGNSRCRVVFVKNGNQTISGTGTANDFYQLILNMGTATTNILDVSSSVFTTPTNFLQLLNGTFKVSTPNAVSLVPYTTAAIIPSSAGIWLNSTTAAMSTSNSVTFSGLIRITNGTLSVGNATNEDLIASGGNLDISGGALNIAGKLDASSAIMNFAMSGGVLNVPSVQSSNTTISPLHLSFSGSQFNMSGGTIVINREGGNGNQNLGFVNTGSTGGTVSGGTLQLGSASSPAAQILRINSTFPVPNLLLNSANITASLVTNSLTVNGNIDLTAGTLNDNGLSIGLSGNWTNSGGSYTSGTGTVVFNSSSAAQSIFKSGGETFNNLLFTGAGIKSFASAVTAKGFTINSGASVDVNSSNFQLSLSGNFINSGTYNARSGLVLLNGTTTQSIGGTSTSDFFNLTLNNTAGASLIHAENLIGTLTLNNGAFNTNSQVFTMVSTSTATARVAQITGTGDITGNVTVQRFVPGGTTGWAFLGTPISSALTLQDWDDDIFISCSSCPDGSAGGFLSVYSYNEAASGIFDNPAAYVPLSGITDPIVFGKGLWVYFGNGQFTTSDITLDVTGTLRKQNQSIPLSYSNFGSSTDDGWNLIHNPYPSAVSWTALRGATANLDNAIYVYNADLNGGLGAYASYVNGVSSPAVGSGGIGDDIPMGQAFFVHSTGATVINATEANKVTANPTFLKSNSSTNVNSQALMRLQLLSNTVNMDETVLYTQAGASEQFEAIYDAFKLPGSDPNAASIALQKDSTLFQINGVAPINGTFTLAVKAMTGVSGNFTISASQFNSFPNNSCIHLFDHYTNSSTDLKTTDYAVYLYDTTSTARFVLSISISSLTVTANVTQPNCSAINGGQIEAQGTNGGPWNYFWTDQNNLLLKSSLNKSCADTLSFLSAGAVHLQVGTVGQCDQSDSDFQISPISFPMAQFTCVDTLDLTTGIITFSNSSSNAMLYYWDFGDGIGTSALPSPNYTYQHTGSYQIRLIAESPDACADTAEKQLIVTDRSTGITNNLFNSSLLIKNFGDNNYLISLPVATPTNCRMSLMDGSGKLLKDFGWMENNTTRELKINLNGFSAGIYLLVAEYGNGKQVFKLPVY